MAGFALASPFVYRFLLRLSARAAGICAIIAVAAGAATVFLMAAMMRFHPALRISHAIWPLLLFAAFELIALIAGYQGRATPPGRWALRLSAWPLVPIVTQVLAGALKTIAAGGGV